MNAPADIYCIQSNMNERNLSIMQSVEVVNHCRNSYVADGIKCPSPTSFEKTPIRSEKWCIWDRFCQMRYQHKIDASVKPTEIQLKPFIHHSKLLPRITNQKVSIAYCRKCVSQSQFYKKWHNVPQSPLLPLKSLILGANVWEQGFWVGESYKKNKLIFFFWLYWCINYCCPTGKNTHFHQHVWHKSPFATKFSAGVRHKWTIAPKISVHVRRKWMT